MAGWVARSTAPGVLFAHDFAEDAELTAFLRGNPGGNPLTLVATPFGSARAIRSRAIGTRIVRATPAGVAGDLQWWDVADASVLADPGAAPYLLLVGSADSGGIEYVKVVAVDRAGNRIRVMRRMDTLTTHYSGVLRIDGVNYAYPTAGSYPASGYTVGKGPDGSWVRPLGSFRAGDNGRSKDDIGIGNGAARKVRRWEIARPDRHTRFREAYFGHRSYWDPAHGEALYKDWLPRDRVGAEAGPRRDAFEGDEVWIQFRARVDSSRFAGGRAKMLYIQNASSGGTGQFFWQVSGKDYDTSPGNYGNVLVPLTAYGDSAAPAGGTLSVPQRPGLGFNGVEIQSVDTFPACQWQHGTRRSCWRIPGDVWVTYLLHFKFGRDNAPVNPVDPKVGGSNGAASTLNLKGPWPADRDPAYRTTFELFVAEEGATKYTKLTSHDAFVWMFGDGKYQAGYYHANPPGLNAIWMSQELNAYIGSGSVAPPPAPHWIDYTQLIVSRHWIPVPAPTRAVEPAASPSGGPPKYMQGLAPYATRLLTGAYAPSVGKDTLATNLPAEWRSPDQPSGARGVVGAWSGGCTDPARKRLYFAGGGHSDGANNGIHVFDFGGDKRPVGFSTLPGSLSRLSDTQVNAANGTYPDGRPTAVHTYSCMQYDARRRTVWRSGSADYGGGGGGSQVWTFSLETGHWTQRAGPVAGPGSVLLMSPDASSTLLISTLYPSRFFDAETYEQTIHGASLWPGSTDQNASVGYDSKRDRYLAIARLSTGARPTYAHFVTVDWAGKRWTAAATQLTGTPADVAKVAGGMAIFYDDQRDSFWAFGSLIDTASGVIGHLLEIDARTLAVTSAPLDPPIACGEYNRGTFSRFVWMPEWRTVGFVYDYNRPAALIRLP